jgi:hypothetical protein
VSPFGSLKKILTLIVQMEHKTFIHLSSAGPVNF